MKLIGKRRDGFTPFWRWQNLINIVNFCNNRNSNTPHYNFNWRCRYGRFVSFDSPGGGRSHRVQSATLSCIVGSVTSIYLASNNFRAANLRTSKCTGIGWQSRTVFPFKNGTTRKHQNGHSTILPSSPTSNGFCRNWRKSWIQRWLGFTTWNTIVGRRYTSKGLLSLLRNSCWLMRFFCKSPSIQSGALLTLVDS